MKPIRAAAIQLHHSPGDKAANMAKLRGFVAQAAGKGVQLLCFPEMCVTGYWHVRRLSREQIQALAEPIPSGAATQELLELSRETGITIGAGLIEEADDGCLYNAYVVAMPDGRWACHRKLHTFISEHMSSGSNYTVFDIPQGVRVGVLTCWDNNLVENVRATALLGAEVLLAPHQTGGCASRSPRAMGPIDPKLWHERETNPEAIEAEFRGPKGRGWLMRWLPARAHDNGLYLLFSNGVGEDDGEVRTGNAMIIDPYGEIMEEAWKAHDDMVVADLEPGVLEASTGRRWLTGRRPELYSILTSPSGKEQDPRKVRFG